MKTTSSEHVVYINCFFVFVLTFKTIYATELVVFMYRTGKSMNNLLSYFGLVEPRISASDKDLPVSTNTISKKIISLSKKISFLSTNTLSCN